MEGSSVDFIHGDLKKPLISSVLQYNPTEKRRQKNKKYKKNQ